MRPHAALLLALACSTTFAADIPATGQAIAELKPLDDAVVGFMEEIGAPAATLAVSRQGRIIYQRGFGWRDAAKKLRTQPDTPMRIASVSKPLTSAAVKRLIAQGKLSLDTPVFPTLKLPVPAGAKPDPRLASVTVGHLLEHKGGWDRAAGFDPMFYDETIRQALRLKAPPTAVDIIRYMMTRPLDFDPGTKSAYSNFGYCVLGRVIEKATGQPYDQHMASTVFKPLGMTCTRLGRTFQKDRPREEVHYAIADGSLLMERMDAHGGMISTAPDLCRWMSAYWIGGEPRAKGQNGYTYTFFGSLPACTALVRQMPDGTDYAVLLNHRRPSFRDDNDKLVKVMDAAVKAVASWPK